MASDMKPRVTIDNINPQLLEAQYAVRGPIVARAQEIEQEIRQGQAKYPFDSLVYCNIGNPQQLKQKPITFLRQVLSLVTYPDLEKIVPPGTFPEDVLERARYLHNANPGGSGAYSASQGVPAIVKDIAAFIERRDGFPADPKNIFMSNGASQCVQNSILLLRGSDADGFMVPIPQYPLYSATISLFGSHLVGYYLDEDRKWGLDVKQLEANYEEAVKAGIRVRGLVVINPGNPTGMCLSREDMKDCIRFCVKRGIVLLADEVYQENVYVDTVQFESFKKVCCLMGEEAKDLQLISFHSTSKGFFGECGRRGGYMELVGFDEEVRLQIVKLWSINLCSNVDGQVAVDVMVRPPKEGEPSYALYAQERDAILSSLKKRSLKLSTELNKLPGLSCEPIVDGALYIFFQVKLPEKAIEEARRRKVAPDFLYCEEMLNATGIVTVAGSGFKQREGTFHVRTTFLPPEDQIDSVVERMDRFQHAFMKKYE